MGKFTRKELLEMKRMGIDPNTVEVMQEGGETEGGDQEQIMQLIQVYAQLSQTSPEEIMGSLQEMEPEAQSQALQQMSEEVQQAMSQGNNGMPVMQLGGMTPQDQQMMQQQMMQQSQQPQGGGEEEQIMQILQAYAQMNQMDEQAFQELVKTFQEASPEQQQQMLEEMVAEIEQAQGGQNPEQMEDPNAQGPEEQMEQNPMMESGGYLSHARQWLQKGGSTNFFQEKYEDPNNPNVNVEHKEVLHTPQGEAFKVHGNTHAEGGIDMNLQEGTKVFSQHIKAPSEIAKRFVKNAKTKMSFADLAGKFTTDKDLKIMNDPNSDKYAKATAAINFERKQEMLNQVFTAQEMFKKAAGLDQIEYTDSNSKKKV